MLQGLRVCVLAGSFGTCAGAWAKVFSTNENGFYIGFIGQAIVAVSQVNLFRFWPRESVSSSYRQESRVIWIIECEHFLKTGQYFLKLIYIMPTFRTELVPSSGLKYLEGFKSKQWFIAPVSKRISLGQNVGKPRRHSLSNHCSDFDQIFLPRWCT